MKKLLTLTVVLALTCGVSLAKTNYGQALKNAVKSDVQATKEAIKKDAQNQAQANAQARQNSANAKKAEKIKQIDSSIAQLEKQMNETKNAKNITETERTLKTKSLQRQIDFYKKQKEALK